MSKVDSEAKAFGKVKLELTHAKSYIKALEKDNESKDSTINELRQKLRSLPSELEQSFEKDYDFKLSRIISDSETLLKDTVSPLESRIKELENALTKKQKELENRPVIQETIEKIVEKERIVKVEVSSYSQFKQDLQDHSRIAILIPAIVVIGFVSYYFLSNIESTIQYLRGFF